MSESGTEHDRTVLDSVGGGVLWGALAAIFASWFAIAVLGWTPAALLVGLAGIGAIGLATALSPFGSGDGETATMDAPLESVVDAGEIA